MKDKTKVKIEITDPPFLKLVPQDEESAKCLVGEPTLTIHTTLEDFVPILQEKHKAKHKRKKKSRKEKKEERRREKDIEFLIDSFARSFKDENIYEEQLKAIEPSFIKELAEKNNTTVEVVKQMFREGKVSIYSDEFLKKVEKYRIVKE